MEALDSGPAETSSNPGSAHMHGGDCTASKSMIRAIEKVLTYVFMLASFVYSVSE